MTRRLECFPRKLTVIPSARLFDHPVQLYAILLVSFVVEIGKADEDVLIRVSVGNLLIERRWRL
jgi:hypothetical protein